MSAWRILSKTDFGPGRVYAGGIAGGVLAVGLWAYHYYADHVWNWELFSIAVTIALVKQGTMLWYRIRG